MGRVVVSNAEARESYQRGLRSVYPGSLGRPDLGEAG